MSKDNNLTTEQLMDAAIKTVEQMSPEEKAKLRKEMDAAQRMRSAFRKVPQLAPEETAKLRKQLRLEVPATGTLQEFAEHLELSYKRLAPADKKRWLAEMREACARFNRLQKTEGGWIQ